MARHPTPDGLHDPARIEIRLLGPFEVEVDGRTATVGGGKRCAVLAALALSAGRIVSLDTLIQALWRVDEPAAPRNAVHHHIARLRAALGRDSIVGFPEGYALAPARVDALEFEQLLARARTALRTGDASAAGESLSTALSLFRGQPLQGLPDSEWISAEAARLEDVRLDALEEEFEAALALGRHREIISSLAAAIEASPFRERLHGQLMLALYRCGRQADALDAFQHARRVLDEELGLEPGPELRRVERAILVQDPEVDLPDRHGASGLLELMGAHLRRAEELYAQALAAA